MKAFYAQVVSGHILYMLCKNFFQIIIIVSDNHGQWQLLMDNYFKDWLAELHVLQASYTAALWNTSI